MLKEEVQLHRLPPAFIEEPLDLELHLGVLDVLVVDQGEHEAGEHVEEALPVDVRQLEQLLQALLLEEELHVGVAVLVAHDQEVQDALQNALVEQTDVELALADHVLIDHLEDELDDLFLEVFLDQLRGLRLRLAFWRLLAVVAFGLLGGLLLTSVLVLFPFAFPLMVLWLLLLGGQLLLDRTQGRLFS